MTTAETGRPRRVSRGTGITWWYVAALLALLALVALVVQNDDRVEFEWLWFDLHASLAALLLATAALTAVLVSTIKIRQAGFTDCVDSEADLAAWFDQLRSRRLIPPRSTAARSSRARPTG